MIEVEQGHNIQSCPAGMLEAIEKAARTCYQTEDRINPGSCFNMVEGLLSSGHGSMLEFADIIVKFTTNRGISHELVRHRAGCSFAQESTRYVRCKGDGGMVFIRPTKVRPFGENDRASTAWRVAMEDAECKYNFLLKQGWKAQDARGVLPNDLKTEIVVKANIRAWRHIFNERCSKASHPQMVALMRGLLFDLAGRVPVVFDDLANKFLKDGEK